MIEKELIYRMNRTEESWVAQPPKVRQAYDALLSTEDNFWDEKLHNSYNRPLWWTQLGQA